MSGICFVGYTDPFVRSGFVLTPVGVAVIIMCLFFIKGFRKLMHLSTFTSVPEHSRELKAYAVRMLAFSVMAFIIVVIFIVLDIKHMGERQDLQKNLRKLLMYGKDYGNGNIQEYVTS